MSSNENQNMNWNTYPYNFLNNIAFNPVMVSIFIMIVVIFVLVINQITGKSTDATTSGLGRLNNFNLGMGSGTETGNGGWSFYVYILVALVSIWIVSRLTGWNIVASIQNVFTREPEIDIKVYEPKDKPPVPEIRLYPEVYNIPGNNYGYEDAQALCKAYGSRLATYQEIENAYNNNAEWCNYGWSEGQMALYPTQQKTYDKLQTIEGHEHDCGRPGINGGYIANPALKFGVNCYGHKPRMTDVEQDLMANQPYYPKTKKDIAMDKRVEYWKARVKDILVSPFNHKNWSRI